MNSPSTVNDPPVDMSPEVNLTDVIVLQDCFVTRIGSVVSRAVVYRATWEGAVVSLVFF